MIDGNGVKHEADIIIYGTGFHVIDAFDYLDIKGKNGVDLATQFREEGVETYMGMTINGFPNLYFMLGPNTALGHNSVVFMIEQQTKFIIRMLDEMDRRGAISAEPTKAAQDEFNEEIQRLVEKGIWTQGGCTSWYLDSKGKNRTIWPKFTFQYWWETRKVNAPDFEWEQGGVDERAGVRHPGGPEHVAGADDVEVPARPSRDHPGVPPGVRRHVRHQDPARPPHARRVQRPRGHQGDLRRRPVAVPRRRGQCDPQARHGRALGPADGRRRAPAGPQAPDAGVHGPVDAGIPAARRGDRQGRGRLVARRRHPRDARPDERDHARRHPAGRLRRHRRGAARGPAAQGQPHGQHRCQDAARLVIPAAVHAAAVARLLQEPAGGRRAPVCRDRRATGGARPRGRDDVLSRLLRVGDSASRTRRR